MDAWAELAWERTTFMTDLAAGDNPVRAGDV
jgi:hypothetical protein